MEKTLKTIILTPYCTSSHAAKEFTQFLKFPAVDSDDVNVKLWVESSQ